MASPGLACGTCPSYDPAEEKKGFCHHGPPHPFLMNGPPHPVTGQSNAIVQGVYVPVHPDTDWCAQHPMFANIGVMDVRLARTEGKA